MTTVAVTQYSGSCVDLCTEQSYKVGSTKVSVTCCQTDNCNYSGGVSVVPSIGKQNILLINIIFFLYKIL